MTICKQVVDKLLEIVFELQKTKKCHTSSLGLACSFDYLNVFDWPKYLFDLSSKNKIYSYLPTPPLGQDMTQGQFLSRV